MYSDQLKCAKKLAKKFIKKVVKTVFLMSDCISSDILL